MLELGVIAAFYAAVIRVLATFDIEVEDEYRDYLPLLPLANTQRSAEPRSTLAGTGEPRQTAESGRG